MKRISVPALAAAFLALTLAASTGHAKCRGEGEASLPMMDDPLDLKAVGKTSTVCPDGALTAKPRRTHGAQQWKVRRNGFKAHGTARWKRNRD